MLPEESRQQAEDLLQSAARDISEFSSGHLRLAWSLTENLGGWAVVRKRLNDGLRLLREAPAAACCEPQSFAPLTQPACFNTEGYFSEQMGQRLRETETVGWSPETPARILLGEGKHSWALSDSPDSIPLARHTAPADDGVACATPPILAHRAEGRPGWGVLRGDVDSFQIRLRRLQTIEEHVQLSVLYKQFFAGELEVLCSMPEFWRKVSIIYSGGDDFAVYGSWDALIQLAGEIQRLFHRFNEESLKDFPGVEGKTISMAISMALDEDQPLAQVYYEAGRRLEIVKSSEKDCLHLFGRIVEWRHLAHAARAERQPGPYGPGVRMFPRVSWGNDAFL